MTINRRKAVAVQGSAVQGSVVPILAIWGWAAKGFGALGLVALGLAALGLTGCASGTPGPKCGNGVVERGEECDDGNLGDGDGCSQACDTETGYACTEEGTSVCSPICGDGLRVGIEQCDGTDLGGGSCEALGLGGGPLACTATCTLDMSGCLGVSCGNGVRDGVEVCEGADLGGETCASQGFDAGTLACTTDCAWDTAGCRRFTCGDALVEGGEQCDDGNASAQDGCSATCAVEEGWECAGEPSLCEPLCGNGVINAGEACDTAQLSGETCESLGLGFVGGTLSCASNCTFNTALCESPLCGNGLLDSGEQCDGLLLGGATCESVGSFVGGQLTCQGNCVYNISACIPIRCGDGIVSAGEQCDDGNTQGTDGCSLICTVETGWECTGTPSTCTRLCGNAALDPGESCDGALLDGETCLTLGYDLGTLACAANCTFDTSSCSTFTCGDGYVTGVEQCDGDNLNGQTCLTRGFLGGVLDCSGNCAFDTSQCIPPTCGDGVVTPSIGEQCDDHDTDNLDGCSSTCQIETGWDCAGTPSTCWRLCGNGLLNPGEQCDGVQFGSATCETLGFVGGSLLCTSGCTFDTTQCTPPSCGDGIVSPSVGEQCDDHDTDNLDGCSAACQVEPGWSCTGQPSVCSPLCGNGQLNAGEDCDGSLFGTETCLTQGFDYGTLACTPICTLNTSGCAYFVCGDGRADGAEDCDGGDLDGESCLTLGFAGGTLGCTGGCLFDTSSCLDSLCPNGIREGTEQCDGSDFGGDDCADYGFSGGTLSCSASCTVVTSGCTTCPATLTSAFSDAFATPNSSTWSYGTDVPVSTSLWSAYTTAQHGVRVYGGRLEITNVRSGYPDHGQGYAYVKTGGTGSDYNNTLYNPALKSNAGQEIVWTLNMRRDDPDITTGGFSCTSSGSQNGITVGLAYVLAGSSAAGLNASASTCSATATAYGYAVVMGGSSGAVRLVRFTSGLRNGTLTNIVSSGSFTVSSYFSVRVTYNAVTDLWRLEARSDGSTSFADPTAGTYSFTGTGTDATYVTSALEYAGPYFQTGCTGLCDVTYLARFDNLNVRLRCAP